MVENRRFLADAFQFGTMFGLLEDPEGTGNEKAVVNEMMSGSLDHVEKPFPFMKLSGELRNRVYEYLFDFETVSIGSVDLDERIFLHEFSNSTPAPAVNRTTFTVKLDENKESRRTYCLYHCAGLSEPISTGILLANHQVYEEAESILYGKHFFLRCCIHGVKAFLEDRPQWVRKHIRKIRLCYQDRQDKAWWASAESWAETCRLIKEDLKIQELGIIIAFPVLREDAWARVEKPLEQLFRETQWLRELVKITDLKKLTFDVYTDQYKILHRGRFSDVADSLEAYLKSKMLLEGGEFIGWRQSFITGHTWPDPGAPKLLNLRYM
ncbi:MAG: hypothetical protein M1835_001649 [Candelina submexicana]|nr:MAG: hypothetical protein M1835_001649 [Candelina submexicana]